MPNWETFISDVVEQDVGDEIDAYIKLERERWPDGPVCPRCSSTVIYFIEPSNGVDRLTHTGNRSVRRLWKCGACRRQFSVLIGTWLEGTKVPLTKWFKAIELLKDGTIIPVRVLAAVTGTSGRTAWLMRNRIRQAYGYDYTKPVRLRSGRPESD